MLDIDKINKTPFFFIVARGRSGTTMLQNILDANKHITIPTESRLIIHLKQKYFNVKKWTPNKLLEFIEDLYRDKKFNRYWKIDKEELKATFNEIPTNLITFQLLCKIIYTSYPSPFAKENICLIGDKNPIYCNFIPELLEIFPNSKFIHLVRDYRANILSDMKTFGYEVLPVVCHGWLKYNKAIEKAKQINPNSFITIKYEDLVNSPEKNMINLCHFLGITFQNEMLTFNQVLKNKVLAEADESIKREISLVHPNIVDPINTAQIEKWKKELTTDQLELIEYVNGSFGENYGYSISKDKPYNSSIKYKSFIGYIRSAINFSIIKYYYNLPLFIRSLMSNTSAFLFEKYNYKNYFNSADFRHKENPKQ